MMDQKPAVDPQAMASPETVQVVPRAQANDFAHRTSRWIHRHPNATKSVLGNATYQFIRGGAAAIPYGISMAATLGGLAGLERAGKTMAEKAAADSFKAGFGKRLAQFASFPAIKVSAMVATSFTLYRGTSKIMKWMHDSLFDPKDNVEQTAQKIQHLPGATLKKIKENAPAGVASTPVAALALGFVNATFTKTPEILEKDARGISLDWSRANYQLAKSKGQGGELLKETLTNPKGKFIEQALIYTLGYSLFFEIGDRLFKDKQVARGVWKGDHNSVIPVKKDEAPPEKKHYGFFTDEPSVGRFAFRRMLPTAVSISAYTAFKFRHSYMLLGDFMIDAKKEILPQIPKLIKIETIAVLWFAMIPLVAEKWEKIYDGFFDRLEKKAKHHDAPAAIEHKPLEVTTVTTPPVTGHAPAHPTAQVGHISREGKAAAAEQAVAV